MHSPSLSLLMGEGFVNGYDRIYEFGLVCIVENPPALCATSLTNGAKNLLYPSLQRSLLTFHCFPSSKSKISVLPQGEDKNNKIHSNKKLTMPLQRG